MGFDFLYHEASFGKTPTERLELAKQELELNNVNTAIIKNKDTQDVQLIVTEPNDDTYRSFSLKGAINGLADWRNVEAKQLDDETWALIGVPECVRDTAPAPAHTGL